MTNITSTCCRAPASTHAAWKALRQVLGLVSVVTIENSDDDDDDVSLTTVTVLALTGTTVSTSVTGASATVRALCALVPTAALWKDSDAMWIDEACFSGTQQ